MHNNRDITKSTAISNSSEPIRMNKTAPHLASMFPGLTRTASAGLLAIAISSQLATASENPPASAPRQAYWGLGLINLQTEYPYKDAKSKTRILPLIIYDDERISFFGAGLDLKLTRQSPISARLRLRYSSDGYKENDSEYLQGMKERKNSVWIGGASRWRNSIADVNAEVLTDTLNNSNGTRGELRIEHRFTVGVIGITPMIAAEWMDDSFVNYYFGVTEAESNTSRASYTGKAAVNRKTGIRLDYSTDIQNSLFLNFGTTYYDDGVTKSPLIDSNSASSVTFGFRHGF
jgi:MipA family protein